MGKFTFGQAGASYECDKVDLNVHEGAPKCPRCNDRVYFNEEKKALGKTWHSKCFSCCKCKKMLSTTNYCEMNGDLICAPCNRRHGMSSTLSTANYAMPTHRYSASVDELTVPGTPTDPQMSRSSSNGSLTRVNRDDPECCPWCGKKVYFAEELKALKRKWHRMCFRCGRCKKTLEPGRFTEHDSTLYCQSCYNKQFGPRGYGYAAGLGSLLSTSDKRQQYTDTFTSYNGYEVQHHDPVEPIRGTQEWTESVFVDTTATPTGTGQPQFYSK